MLDRTTQSEYSQVSKGDYRLLPAPSRPLGVCATLAECDDGRHMQVHLWFWAWLLLAGIFAASAVLTPWRTVLPFAAGSASAAALDAAGASPGWQWWAFLGVGCGLYIAWNRVPRYVGKHRRRSEA